MSAAALDLERRLFHPGGLCPGAGSFVVPLLAAAEAAQGATGARVDALGMLAGLAREARDTRPGSAPADLAACRAAFESAVPALLRLAADRDPEVRAAVVAVVGGLGWCADAVLPALLGRFARERAAAARLALVLAVGHLVGTASQRRAALTWLRRRRSGTDPDVRLAARALAWRTGPVRPEDLARLLAQLPAADPAMLPRARLGDWLADELGDDRDARVAVAARLFEVPAGAGTEALRVAATAIGTWRSAAGTLLPAVAGRLTDPDPAVRGCAAHVLAVAAASPSLPGGAAHADALAAALADPAARVADLAAWGLARLGDPRCLPRLRNRALIGTSVFEVARTHYPRGVHLFSAPGLFDVLAPLHRWPAELLPRICSALSDADSYHQRRVLAAVLARWGPAAAPAVAELGRLLDSDAAVDACAALGAAGAAGAAVGHRLFRLVETGRSSRLRAMAAWAHWRVTGDPEPALRVLPDALAGDLGPAVVPLVADLGRHAAGGAARIARLGAAGGHRLRVDAARALWLVRGDAEPAWALLRPVLAPLSTGRVSPAAVRATAVAGQLPDPPADLVATLRAVATGDRRYSCYGDWRAVTDDDELARLAAVVCR